MTAAERRGDLLFVGDVHLDRGDPEVGPFCRMLETKAREVATLVLAGDLFNLWIAGSGPEPDHIGTVLDCLRKIRSGGTAVHYLEGNRDYFIRDGYQGDVFDRVAADGLVLQAGGLKVFAVHGDLANPGDLQYRRWRRISRSLPVRLLLRAAPAGWTRRAAERLEARMRRTNLEYKRSFPEAEVLEYAAPRILEGCDLVVLGHFHLERELQMSHPGRGRIFVLPEWKGSRRCLRVTTAGRAGFEPAT